MAEQTTVVSSLNGQAWVRTQDGSLKPIREGDVLPAGAEVVTAEGASLQLQPEAMPAIEIGGGRTLALSGEMFDSRPPVDVNAVDDPADPEAAAIIAALSSGGDPFDDLDPTAAVNAAAAASGNDGSNFIRVASIIETTIPMGLEYPRPGLVRPEEYRLGDIGLPNSVPELNDLIASLMDQLNNDSDAIVGLDVGKYFMDRDGDVMTFSATGLPPGLIIDPVTGVISGLIDKSASQGGPGSDGVYQVTITATDIHGASVDLGFTWTTLNPPPVVTDDEATTEENTVVTGNLMDGYDDGGVFKGVDYDPDGDTITVVNISPSLDPDNPGAWTSVPSTGATITGTNNDPGKGGGSFTIFPDGRYEFNPGTDFDYLAVGEETTVTITYQISDGEGGFDTAKLVVTVTGSNDAPEIDVVDKPTDPDVVDPGAPDSAAGYAIVKEADLFGGVSSTFPGKIDFSDLDDSDTHTVTLSEPSETLKSQGVPIIWDATGGKTLVGKAGGVDVITVTIDDAGNYTVTLNAPVDHENADGQNLLGFNVGVTVTDNQGAAVNSVIHVTIQDDVPEAFDDFNEVKEDDTLTAVGNVITGLAAGDVADKVGADGFVLTNIEFGAVSEPVVSGTDTVIQGDYGTLTIKADGSYTYELDNTILKVQALNAGDAPVEIFKYTIKDGDGDVATAELKITVNGTDDGVTVEIPTDVTTTVLDGDKTDHVVFESALATGSQPSPDDLVVESAFTLKALDGLATTDAVTLNYVDRAGNPQSLVLSKDNVEALSGTPKTIETQYGSLVLNGYSQNLVDGTITINYGYKLEVAPTVPGTDTIDSINVTVKDRDGSSANQNLGIKIMDDAPTARDDANAVKEDDTLTAAGNVMTGGAATDVADTVGADGAVLTNITFGAESKPVVDGIDTVIQGEYGKLTIKADGSYTYELDNASLKVQGLNAGDAPVEVFKYTIKDADGDVATAELEITVNGTDDGVTVVTPSDITKDTADGTTTDHVVFESGLADGSSPNSNDLLVNSAFTIEALDGLHADEAVTLSYKDRTGDPQTLVLTKAELEDLVANPQAIETQYGSMILNGYNQAANGTITVGYQYTLQVAPKVSGDDVTESFTVAAKDRDTSVNSSNFGIKIVDDAPTAKADTNQVTEGDEITSVSTAVGNVILGDAQGGVADIAGADGVTVSNIVFNGTTDIAGVVGAGLPGNYGTLTINDDGTYTYQLNNSNLAVQGLIEGEKLFENFTYTIEDADGDKSTATLIITINGADDGVTVTTPSNTTQNTADGKTNDHVVFESGLADGNKPNVNDLLVNSTFTIRALDGLDDDTAVTLSYKDRAGDEKTLVLTKAALEDLVANPQTVPTQYGSMILNGYSQAADGTITVNYQYTLELAPNVTGTDVTESFTVVAKDRDGDDHTGNFDIKIVDDVPVAVDYDGGHVKEDAIYEVSGNVWSETSVSYGADLGADVDALVWGTPTATLDTDKGGVQSSVPVGDLSDYGILTLDALGNWKFELTNSSAAVQALNPDQKVSVSVQYTLTDKDGDFVTKTVKFEIQGTNDAPTVTTKDEDGDHSGDVREEGHGVPGNNEATGRVGGHDVDNDHTLTWTVNTAGTQANEGKVGDEWIINGTYGKLYLDSTDGNWRYELDQSRPETDALGNKDKVQEIFNVQITDEYGANVTQNVTINIQGTNDAPTAENDNHVFNEDSGPAEGNVLTNDKNPEGDLTVIKVEIDGTEFAIPAGPDGLEVLLTATGTTLDSAESIGTLIIKQNGEYSFQPKEHYSGLVPSIVYTVQEKGTDDGEESLTDNATLTFEINPVADAPTMVAPAALTVKEDTEIALGLKAPLVVDNKDLNDSEPGDNPELLGVITISGIPSGAIIHGLPGGNTVSDGTPLKVVITDHADHGHIKDAASESGVIELTKAQFEALSVTPPEHDSTNFSVTVTATSYEVNNDGVPLSGVAGAQSSTVTAVTVLAVTDDVTLNLKPGSSFDATEDKYFNLTAQLEAGFQDLDTSEKRWITIEGVPQGTKVKVDGTVHTIDASGQITIDAKSGSAGQTGGIDSFPKIEIKAPSNYSGTINNIKVTLGAQDQDADNPSHVAEVKEAVVTLDLNVKPDADGIKVTKGAEGVEDTLITNVFAGIKFNGDTDRSETITSMVISGIPNDWVLTRTVDGVQEPVEVTPDGKFVVDVSGVIDTPARLAALLKDYNLMPPAHSSKDLTLTVTATTKDSATGLLDSEITQDIALVVTVTPVAEKIDGAISEAQSEDNTHFLVGEVGDDLTMTKGKNYDGIEGGLEDGWFALSVGGFKLTDDWSNVDGDPDWWADAGTTAADEGTEKTYALLTPILKDGVPVETAKGAKFSYTDNGQEITVEFDGKTPVEIPVYALDTVKFMAPEHVSGLFDIRIQAKTVDTDKDLDDDTTDTAISGQSWLTNILVKPVADGINSLLVKPASGLEDSKIALNVNLSSLDPSETFNLKLSDIPEGSKVFYNGDELVVAANGEVTIDGFTNGTSLQIQPPLNSNVDFALNVQAQTVDSVTINGKTHTDTSDWSAVTSLPVKVKGVADEAIFDFNGTVGTPVVFEEGYLDGHDGTGSESIKLNELINTVTLHDSDRSESLSFKITGLPKGFDLKGDGVIFMGGSGEGREWVISVQNPADMANFSDVLNDVLSKVELHVPEHYSGKVPGTITAVTTENDGDSKTGSSFEFNAVIMPTPESSVVTTSTVQEDQYGQINFKIANNHGDENESLTAVYIRVDQASGDDYALYLGNTGTLLSAAGFAPVEIDGVEYYKLTDPHITNVYLKADPNFAHNTGGGFDFEVKYEITDHASDASGLVGTTIIDDEHTVHTVHVKPVTDKVELSDFVKQEVDHHGDFDVAFTVTKPADANANNQADLDGSEQLTQVVVGGVPQGMIVTGVTVGGTTIDNVAYLGGGRWLVTIPKSADSSFTGDINGQLHFKSGSLLSNGEYGSLTVTTVTRDEGADNTESATKGLIIDSQVPGGGSGSTDVVSTEVVVKDYKGTEDTGFKLSDVLGVTIQNHGVANSNLNSSYSVIVKLPAGAQIFKGDPTNPNNEIKSTTVGGEEVWVISGKGNQAQLDEFLDNLTVIPPENLNDNKGGMPLDVTVTTYLENGSQGVTPVPDNSFVSLKPVTDGAVVEIGFSAAGVDGLDTPDSAQEGRNVAITIGLTEGVDTDSTFDGFVYLQLSESSKLTGGSLLHPDGTALSTVEVGPDNPIDGLAAGTYYVIPAPDGADKVNVLYKPHVDKQYTSGEITVNAWVSSQEAGADNWVMNQSNATGKIEAVNNGYEIMVGEKDPDSGVWTQTGLESQHIELDVTGQGLFDTDGSESVIAAKLEGIPNGFLVFVDGQLASNAGVQTDGTNTWLIPVTGNTLPGNISILPPEYWSGTLNDLKLSVLSGEQGNETWSTTEQTATFNLKVKPVSDGIQSFEPQKAFNDANGVINFNLNIALIDRDDASVAGYDDENMETVSLKFTGLGENALFVLNGEQPDKIEFDVDGGYTVSYSHGGVNTSFTVSIDDDGNYVINGLSQDVVNDLGVIQTSDQITGPAQVSAWTVDGDADASTAVDKSFDITMFDHPIAGGTDGDDMLVGNDNANILLGGEGDDILIGGKGDDILIGGKGDDILVGGAGDDIFKWEAGDAGTTENPAEDIIRDFGLGGVDNPYGEDKIDLTDLLTGDEEKLITDYLSVEKNGADTVINVNTDGNLAADGANQKIVLQNVNLADYDADTVAQFIQDFIEHGKSTNNDGNGG
ncbi:retention module-containing protein [Orrella sp. 11846]|uniref:retention module-containing protein n=1 Tax=Orrella sp. 11846 TaxID=3409913 RepID=UPI003B5C0876